MHFGRKKKKEEDPRAMDPRGIDPDIERVSSTSSLSIRKKRKEQNHGEQHPRHKRPPSRFSLRRLFYGNPLLAQPFLQSPLTTTASATAPAHHSAGGSSGGGSTSRKRPNGGGGAISATGSGTGDAVSWKDNISACSSLQGAAAVAQLQATVVGADGKVIRECPLCLLSVPLCQFPLLRNCHHLFCLDCLQCYVKIELQEGRANVKCPQCSEQLHPNDIESLIGDRNSGLLRLYESLMLRRLLSTNPDTRWCPGPNCTYAVIATGCASCPKITCERPGCGYSFCYHCKAEWHPNQTCDMARAQRQQQQQPPAHFKSSSASFSQESGAAMASGLIATASEVKVCPRCSVLIVKSDDGSCNHMTCSVCGAEFCWLCMKEISDLHYLSPSGCTFWGKKPWSRKKKLMWQLGTLVGAPVGIALLAGISIPAMLIGIPVWVGRKLHAHYRNAGRCKRNAAITGGVVASIVVSPGLACLAVSIGVPILLAYVYGVVPISLCRSENCLVSTAGVNIDVDEEEMATYRKVVNDLLSTTGVNASGVVVSSSSHVANPSIGEVSLSLGSACHLDAATGGGGGNGESASNVALAGTSRTVSIASSGFDKVSGGRSAAAAAAAVAAIHRLEVDVHAASGGSCRKKFSLSSETVSLGDRSDGSTRALAGSLLSGRGGCGVAAASLAGGVQDSQSVHSWRSCGAAAVDEISLRSLPASSAAVVTFGTSTNAPVALQQQPPPQQQRSLSPVSQMSGDELASGRKSARRRPHLDKQLSENSSLLSAEDAISERVRFDDNVSFIDEDINSGVFQDAAAAAAAAVATSSVATAPKMHKPTKLDTSGVVVEETAEELALVISPEPKRNELVKGDQVVCDQILSSRDHGDEDHVTRLCVGGPEEV